MANSKSPRLRTVEKVKPPFQLNSFPRNFHLLLAKEIVYLLATKGKAVLEGAEWEEIFANCIGAKWKPSNVGLDDVALENCAWGAKTVKANDPHNQKTIRLISGRNSPGYSFGTTKISKADPNQLGEEVLSIWNERVSSIRQYYKHLRTVVLIKSNDLKKIAVFEFDTIRYEPELYTWLWNERGNLEGYSKQDKTHRFTWQPHGSQFTIIEDVPDDCLCLLIKSPQKIDKNIVIENLGFDDKWVTIIKKNG